MATATSPVRVETRALTKEYREGDAIHAVLCDVSVVIEPGELVAVLGPSGSGKSTLLNLVGGMDLPTAGDVLLDEVAINRMSETERTLFRRNHVGFVFQFFNLVPTLDVEENLRLPLELAGIDDGDDRVGEVLAAVGLADRRATFPDRLSGGEQQRVAVARAVIADPTLVLADEPTGNLDHETGVRVLDLLEGLVRARRTTMLLATHSREAAARADRVLELRDGVLLERPAPVDAVAQRD